MFSRTALFLGILGAAALLPVVVSSDAFKELLGKRSGTAEDATPNASRQSDSTTDPTWQPPTLPAADSLATVPVSGAAPVGRPVELPLMAGPPVGSLADLVHWQIEPEWVVRNWARVSVVPQTGDFNLKGLRGALVTGTQEHDVCGTITYYFDPQRTLQRILVTGNTGQSEPLVELATQKWKFVAEPRAAMGVYVRRGESQLEGVLAVVHAPIIRSSRPGQRYRVFLEMVRPGGSVALSDEAQRWLRPVSESRALDADEAAKAPEPDSSLEPTSNPLESQEESPAADSDAATAGTPSSSGAAPVTGRDRWRRLPVP